MPEEESADLSQTVAMAMGFLSRRWWLIVITACTVTLVAVAVIWKLPNRYTSSATLLVAEQQVPQRYVVPNSTTDLTSALQAMKQEVLSRTQLLKMINDFGLYPKQRNKLAPEQLVALMLNNIDITPLSDKPERRDFDAFKVSFTTEDALVAQQITSTLTSLFINQHLKTREDQSTNTTNFLREQLELKKTQLDELEQRLRDFKMQHIGELPEQQQGNLGILSGLQAQLQNTMAALNRAQQQRVYLQSLLDAYTRQAPSSAAAVPAAPGMTAVAHDVTPLEAAENELSRLQDSKAALLAKSYTPDHPDVRKIQREVARAEDTVRRLKTAAPRSEKNPVVATSPRPSRTPREDPALTQLKSQLEANHVEMENLAHEERRLKASIAVYENRLNQTPVREQQQAGIDRDTQALRQEYAELQKKEQESQLATNLEKQQGGQQFRVVDPASLPTVPTSPKRMKLSLSSAGAGLALAFALAFALELRDTSFHTEKEMARYISPPFILAVPLLTTAGEERREKLKLAVQVLTASILLIAVLASALYTYRLG